MSSNASPSEAADQLCNENSNSGKFDMWNVGHSGNSPEPDESPVPGSFMDTWLTQQQDEQRLRYEDRAAEDGIHLSDEETLQSSRNPESPPQSSTHPSALDSTSSNSQRVEGGPANVSRTVSPSEIAPPALGSTSTSSRGRDHPRITFGDRISGSGVGLNLYPSSRGRDQAHIAIGNRSSGVRLNLYPSSRGRGHAHIAIGNRSFGVDFNICPTS